MALIDLLRLEETSNSLEGAIRRRKSILWMVLVIWFDVSIFKSRLPPGESGALMDVTIDLMFELFVREELTEL